MKDVVHMKKKNNRSSGVIMHISSLPSPYGIGRMGKEAYEFVDWLESAGQKVWQILPLSPTSFGDSPYQSFSVNAGNPYFIDLDTLIEEGFLTKTDVEKYDWGSDSSNVDYEKIFNNTFPLLKQAYKNFIQKGNISRFKSFKKENSWTKNYGLFMALKSQHNGASWDKWEKELAFCEEKAMENAEKTLCDEIDFYAFLQYEFYKQWSALKQYANEKGIQILGDIPIYVAYDSVEVWTKPELFYLDSLKRPVEVAGCPPDCFSPLGQLWGNPLYDWPYHEFTGYEFWLDRIKAAQKLYDIIRIDHFRGFDSFYAIPFGSPDAVNGRWVKGVGYDLFKTVKMELGDVNIIAEDLGFITKSVEKLLKKCGFPGMKVLEFGFDSTAKSPYLPHNFQNSNCVCYTGTHDNDTVVGWAKSLKGKELNFCKQYLNVKTRKGICEGMIRLAWSSVSDLAIAQIQDVLELGSASRMNIPSTIGTNWKFRVTPDALTPEIAEKLKHLTQLYNR